MAEIRVEEKRGGLGWLWTVIALVLAAALVWYLMTNRDSARDGATTPADSARTSMALPITVPTPVVLVAAA